MSGTKPPRSLWPTRSQVTGQIGVALLTAAPGIANGVAPLFSASQAESPVLVISGDSSVGEDGMGAFQELDQVAMTAPLTKWSHRVTDGKALVSAIDTACATALADRCGPVHLALPFDVLTREAGLDALPAPMPDPAPVAPELAAIDDIDAIADLLGSAQRPLILAGPTLCRARHRPTLDACSRRSARRSCRWKARVACAIRRSARWPNPWRKRT